MFENLPTIAKALAGGLTAWGVTELHHRFDIHIPMEVQTALIGLITALVVWRVPNREPAAEQRKPEQQKS